MKDDLSTFQPQLDNFIDNALREDVGPGDYSSEACIPGYKQGKARLLVKEDGIIAGVKVAEYIFRKEAPGTLFKIDIPDGTAVKKGDIVFTIEGPIRSILMLERLTLNIMQRMTGIATRTHQMVSHISDLKTKLLDTRKTTPGMRFLEKWAVRIGGGVNHRFGLYDMIMLKDNHIDGAGGVQNAITASRKFLQDNNLNLPIEVETRDLKEVQLVIDTGGIDRIMFDNFSIPDLQKAILLVGEMFETEASGGINEQNLREYALTGVDYISTSITIHSAKSIDLSLKLF